MSIRDVELEPFTLALRRPLQTAHGETHVRSGFVVRLTLEDGAVALGEATPLESFGTEGFEECGHHLQTARSALAGRPAPDEVSAIRAIVESLIPGEAPAARCGLEHALLEQWALRLRVPVARLLSASPHPSVPVNALLVEQAPAALAREAAEAVARGHRTVKLKVGSRFLGEDVDRLRAVREAVGARAVIRLDANAAWSEEKALLALEAFVGLEPELCEQPVPPGDPAALGRLRDATPIRIAADESLAVAHEALALVESNVVDALVLKPMVLGGLLPALELARRADAKDIRSYVTHSLDGPIARAAALHLALALPTRDVASGLAATGLFQGDDPLAGWMRNGSMSLDAGAGWGDALTKLR